MQGRSTAIVAVIVAGLAAALAIWLWQTPPTLLQIPAGSRSVFSPPVRINLTPKPVPSVNLEIAGPYEIRLLGSPRVLHRGRDLQASRVTVSETSIRIGPIDAPASRLEIVAERDPAVWVNDHQYRGRLHLYRRPRKRLFAVNVVPLEDYVASVVNGEMPRAFGPAARGAQAVVARTYALYHMQQRHAQFDLFASSRSQKYLGFQYRDQQGRWAGESPDSRRAAQATAGIVLTERGRLFCTYYSAVCGGRTTPGSALFRDAAPPLQSVVCEWCRPADRYRWRTAVPRSTASATLAGYFHERRRPFKELAQISVETGGALPKFRFGDGRHSYTLSGAELRRVFPDELHSPHFTAELQDDVLRFAGRGHGHGVGLCQWGARGRGLAGQGTLAILQAYYPGSTPVILQDDLTLGDDGQQQRRSAER